MAMRRKVRALVGAPALDGDGAAAGRETSPGFMATVGRVAVVVGCLTAIVGLGTSAKPLWSAFLTWLDPPPPARPLIQVTPGGVMAVRWAPNERRLTFAYNADLKNAGNAPDTFLSARAYLLDPLAQVTGPGIRAALTAIEMTENDSGVRFPLSVETGQTRALRLLVTPDQVDQADPFAEAGVYRLVLELEKHGDASRGTYCFFLGPTTLAQLHAQQQLNVYPYLECKG